ncbi:M23 family metallopeptidase [Erythrobacter litoralis]|uniref:M23 family metallopeptidase n=1 Tax=Erythrobacter litoralis TaxID=39960 RepID=UPI0024351A77|nr:M23 family metallopeptidase [Erythrobacter litoralis]MDG6079332.1 M23 family metallopeptidase [Erythrobacter litoralis]
MINKRITLAIAATTATFGIAAAPAQAEEATAAAAAGAIDMSKVAENQVPGDDAQFQELFAKWENPNQPAVLAGPIVTVPSRMPVEHARLSSGYGTRTHPVLGRRMGHKGIDLAAPIGTPIYATADGTVSRAGPFSSYGNYVAIEHGGSIQTRYAHMSRIAVATGATVKKGDIIGYVGSTGRSTGPHLHYEVRVDGEAVNPVPYMIESQTQQAFALATGE